MTPFIPIGQMKRSEFYTLFGFAANEAQARSHFHKLLQQSVRRNSVMAVMFGGVLVFALLQFDYYHLSLADPLANFRLLKLAKLSLEGLSPFKVNAALNELVEFGSSSGRHSWNLQMLLVNRITQNLKSQAYRLPRVEACKVEESLEAVRRAIEAMEEKAEIQDSEEINASLAGYLSALDKHSTKQLSPRSLGTLAGHLLEHAKPELMPQVCVSLQIQIQADDSYLVHLRPQSIVSLCRHSQIPPCTNALVYLAISPATRPSIAAESLPALPHFGLIQSMSGQAT
jgi:hypothetical protein